MKLAEALLLRSDLQTKLASLQPSKTGTQFIAGIVSGMRTKITANGKMAFVTLDDGESVQEVLVFNELFDAQRKKIEEDELIIIEAKVQRDDFAGEGRVRVSAERLFTLAEARERFARCLRLSIQLADNPHKQLQQLQIILAPYASGSCPVRIAYASKKANCELLLGENYCVRPENELLNSLASWLSPENVRLDYQ